MKKYINILLMVVGFIVATDFQSTLVAMQNTVKGANDNVKTTDDDGPTPLHLAAHVGDSDAVTRLLVDGANILAIDSNGFIPLHLAAMLGHDATVKQLLTNKASINATDPYGCTPLHWASKNGHIAVVTRLLDLGANPIIRNINGNTALDLALQFAKKHDHTFVVMKLMDAEHPNTSRHVKYSSVNADRLIETCRMLREGIGIGKPWPLSIPITFGTRTISVEEQIQDIVGKKDLNQRKRVKPE